MHNEQFIMSRMINKIENRKLHRCDEFEQYTFDIACRENKKKKIKVFYLKK